MSTKVKILSTTVAGGKDVKKGDTVEVSERDAAILLQLGKAEIAKAGGDKKADEEVGKPAEKSGDSKKMEKTQK